MKVIYVYDALCGWCYGFSPVMDKFYEANKDSVLFEVISGGMITGERIGPIGEVAGYISKAYKDVERATGVRFGEGFLNNTMKKGTAIFTSIPPSIALTVFKELQPKNQVAFAAALQKAIYYDGIEPEDYEAYGKIAANFGLDSNSFVLKMKEPEYFEKAKEDFSSAGKFGVTGFPSVFVLVENSYYKIASGYVPLDALERNFQLVKDKY